MNFKKKLKTDYSLPLLLEFSIAADGVLLNIVADFFH